MSRTQWAIIGILVAAVAVVYSFLAFLVISERGQQTRERAAVTLTAMPTDTPGATDTPTPTNTPTATTTPTVVPLGIVEVAVLNVRAGPGTNYNIIGKLRQDDAVEIKARQGEWLAVVVEGKEGWLYAEYVRVDVPLDAIPTPTPSGG